MNSLDLASLELGSTSSGSELLAAPCKQSEGRAEGLISFRVDVPEPLQLAMAKFIDRYPNWDQYRLIKAAIAGFLVQNGSQSRNITRIYIENMFNNQASK
tara:strand:- start:756 stop:1055 length:300 start_codon:yes stop_codon:yes gene_type:complete